jgi:hypothetical protein
MTSNRVQSQMMMILIRTIQKRHISENILVVDPVIYAQNTSESIESVLFYCLKHRTSSR